MQKLGRRSRLCASEQRINHRGHRGKLPVALGADEDAKHAERDQPKFERRMAPGGLVDQHGIRVAAGMSGKCSVMPASYHAAPASPPHRTGKSPGWLKPITGARGNVCAVA